MKIASKKKKLVIISSISIIILTLLVLFIIKPVILKLENSSGTILGKKAELESLTQKETVLPRQEKELENLKDKLPKILRAIPAQDEVINFIIDLEQIAHKNNVTQSINIKEGTAKAEKEEEGLRESVFKLTLAGSFPDIINYIINLENLEYYADINSLNITHQVSAPETVSEVGPTKLEPGTVNVNLDVALYVKE